MARIRTIKPEFFTSESIVSLEPLARLLFIGLWCEADREGRLAWKLNNLKMRYLPVDDADINRLADSLLDSGLIIIYSVDDKEYCQVVGFSEHQVINNRERDSVLPSFFDASTTRESGVQAEGRKEGKGKEGKERKEGESPPAAAGQKQKQKIPYQEIIDSYNQELAGKIGLPKVVVLNAKRKRLIDKAWKYDAPRHDVRSIEYWSRYFSYMAEKVTWIRPDQKRTAEHENWQADFDYCIREDVWVKVIEGTYTNETV
jgi:hypothetical protein